jgi:hypothetical protein
MRKLTVKNFSVIKEAELEFGKITVLIGPQSSGKSLLCKLAYFLSREILEIAIGRTQNHFDFSMFEEDVRKKFAEWFPRSGWGNQLWTISLQSDRYEVTASGVSTPTEEISFSFCEEFRAVYAKSQTYAFPDNQYWPAYLLRDLAGQGVWDRSTYVPSERSYFVDTNKDYRPLVSDPEPIVQAFALLYSNARDPKIPKPRMQHYLGGGLEQGEDEWRFVFDDGRIVSLSNLSSGSKELLPLFCALEMYEHQRPNTQAQINNRLVPGDTYRSDDFYIEEPEGHIFPDMQQHLVRYFAELANSDQFHPHFTVTTHSPYILSAFNNLIEAGQVARTKPELKDEVAKIIPEQYWIKEGDFKAYAIEDGKLKSILNESGFVEGNYLDQVSETIGDEFDRLIKLEYDHAKAS